MVTIAVPLLIALFFAFNRHYRRVGRRLRAGVAAVAAAPAPTNEVVLHVESSNAALREALWYAREVAGDGFRAIHVPGGDSDPGIRPRFRELTDLKPDLDIVQPEDGRVDAVIEYLWALPRGESSFVTVVIPELFKRQSLVEAVMRRVQFSLKVRLLTEPGVVITDVPMLARKAREWRPPNRAACRILVSGAHAASMRAVNYASTLGFEDTRAVFFAFDHDEAERLEREWYQRKMSVALEIEEAPFRDLGDPLLHYLRRITADPDTVAVAIMPELVFTGSARLLHNQRALYIKRLLLFEPRVILASVPYRLARLVQCTIRTSLAALRATAPLTLIPRARSMSDRSCEPRTIRSAPIFSATSTIISAGSPCAGSSSGMTPRSPRSAFACSSCATCSAGGSAASYGPIIRGVPTRSGATLVTCTFDPNAVATSAARRSARFDSSVSSYPTRMVFICDLPSLDVVPENELRQPACVRGAFLRNGTRLPPYSGRRCTRVQSSSRTPFAFRT